MSISLVAEGHTSDEIAELLVISRKTVEGTTNAVALAELLRDDRDMLESTPLPGRRSPQPKGTGEVEPIAGEPEAGVGTIPQADEVDASGAASFPASDPPSWWGGR